MLNVNERTERVRGHPGDRYTYYGKRLYRNNMAGPQGGSDMIFKRSKRSKRSALYINVVGVALKQNHILTFFSLIIISSGHVEKRRLRVLKNKT